MRQRAGLPAGPQKRPVLPDGSLMRPRPARPPGLQPLHTEDALDPAEELHLCRRWLAREDADALRILIEAHLGLVRRIATEFRASGPAHDDLVQEGRLGLVIAARRYDPSKSARLATYASYWIRACMMDLVVRTHGAVRVGTRRAERRIFFGLGRARRALERSGVEATSEALAGELGVEVADLESMTARIGTRDVSLDAPRALRDGDGPSLAASLQGDGPTPEDLLGDDEESRRRRLRFRDALASLTPRERAIIEARHLVEEPPTLAELGERLGISRERVRQLEARAVARLRTRCNASRPRHAVHA